MVEDLEAQLKGIVAESVIGQVLPTIAKAELPGWWLAGGAVRNTVWKHLFGEQCALKINDFDVAFFDREGNRAQELKAKAMMEAAVPAYKFDVKNQASFAVWRPGRRKYASSEDGIGNWLHTATAVGVRIDSNNVLAVLAPYGLEDLFGGIVRPTPENHDTPEAKEKGQTFIEKCPQLRLASG